MAYEFTKLSDVTLADTLDASANVLVEENGEIKKAPKSVIGAQADWNETDDTNPAYILNKPESLGGYKYYYYYNYYLYKAASPTERPSTIGNANDAISKEAFESDYYNSPIMLCDGIFAGNNIIIGYSSYYNTIAHLNSLNATIGERSIFWGQATE